MVGTTEVSLVVYKTTFKQHVNTDYPFSKIHLLPHSSLGLSKASFSNYLIHYSRCFADPFLRERRQHKSNYSPGAQSDPFKGLL